MATKVVEIKVKGGMVIDVKKPAAIMVVVKDYDVQNSVDSQLALKSDDDGEYAEEVW